MDAQVKQVNVADTHIQNVISAHRAVGPDFSKVLAAKAKDLKFSAHAQARLKSRNIEMTPEILQKLDKAVDGAAKKGSKDSLVLLSDLAFIVNIPNRTVVTAMDGSRVKENVFTNIDSAVIAG
jgi:flagellar operon protein